MPKSKIANLPQTVGDWVKLYEENHWKHTPRTPTKENSFHKGYRLIFNRLPQQEPLSAALLRTQILDNTKPGSRNRKGWAMALRRLGEFAGLDPAELKTISTLGKGYSPKSVEPRTLPSDDEILDIWQSVDNEAWRWVISVLAIYGLRPHELFGVRTDCLDEDPPVLEVLEETKTGFRIAYPCRAPQWELFTPEVVAFPQIETVGKNNNQLGAKIGQEFAERGFPFTPYALRHAYARRMFLKGFPSDFVAKSMGHDEAVQRKLARLYSLRNWIEYGFKQVKNELG